MTPLKIIIEIDDMGVQARVFVRDEQKIPYWKDQPVEPVEVAFMVRELLEKYL